MYTKLQCRILHLSASAASFLPRDRIASFLKMRRVGPTILLRSTGRFDFAIHMHPPHRHASSTHAVLGRFTTMHESGITLQAGLIRAAALGAGSP